jgi:hypothetical protein
MMKLYFKGSDGTKSGLNPEIEQIQKLARTRSLANNTNMPYETVEILKLFSIAK